MTRSAVILLSGGLDSATVLAIAQSQGYACHALSFDYGQRHRRELDAARRLATAARIPHHISTIDLRAVGGSALTAEIPVPKDQLSAGSSSVPITYVPARNTVFLSFALAWAEVLSAYDLFLGVNALDYSGYPDCRPEFIAAFEKMANLATKAAVEGHHTLRLHTPLIDKRKHEIIQWGLKLGVDYALTHSCYDPDPAGRACGHCDSCQLRLEGFRLAGTRDPIAYAR